MFIIRIPAVISDDLHDVIAIATRALRLRQRRAVELKVNVPCVNNVVSYTAVICPLDIRRTLLILQQLCTNAIVSFIAVSLITSYKLHDLTLLFHNS